MPTVSRRLTVLPGPSGPVVRGGAVGRTRVAAIVISLGTSGCRFRRGNRAAGSGVHANPAGRRPIPGGRNRCRDRPFRHCRTTRRGDRLGHHPPDRRRHHEAVPAETGGHPEAPGLPDRAHDRLVVRRHVVGALGDDPERDEREQRQRLVDARTDVGAPGLGVRVGVARRREVAREHAPAGEVLRREVAVDEDDERLEQPLGDRFAEEQVLRLRDDRQLDLERCEQRPVCSPAATTTVSAGACVPSVKASRQRSPSRLIASTPRCSIVTPSRSAACAKSSTTRWGRSK